jgi:hypothetical protein
MSEQDTRTLVERIVRRLFTNGAGERAERLVLTVDGPPKRDLGGWCELAAIDQVEAVLALSTPSPAPQEAVRGLGRLAHPRVVKLLDDAEASDDPAVVSLAGYVRELVAALHPQDKGGSK